MKKLLEILSLASIVLLTYSLVGCCNNDVASNLPTSEENKNACNVDNKPAVETQPAQQALPEPQLQSQPRPEPKPEPQPVPEPIAEKEVKKENPPNICFYKFSVKGLSNRKENDDEKNNTFWYKYKNEWKSFSTIETNKHEIFYSDAEIVLYRKIADGNDDKCFSKITSIKLPNPLKDVFIIIAGTETDPKFYLIDASPDKLPKGKIAIVNMTKFAVDIKFGEDAKSISPDTHAIFAEPSNRPQGKSIPLAISVVVDGISEVAYKSRVLYPDQQRPIMFVYDTSKNKYPRLNIKVVQH